MSVLQRTSREQVKKSDMWTTLIIIDFGCGRKYRSAELTAEACNVVVWRRKDFVFTNRRMGLNGIWQLIRARFPFFTHCTPRLTLDKWGQPCLKIPRHKQMPLVEGCPHLSIVLVAPANVTDDAGVQEMLTRSHRLFPVETCEYSAILLFCTGDGYRPDHLTQEFELVYPQIIKEN